MTGSHPCVNSQYLPPLSPIGKDPPQMGLNSHMQYGRSISKYKQALTMFNPNWVIAISCHHNTLEKLCYHFLFGGTVDHSMYNKQTKILTKQHTWRCLSPYDLVYFSTSTHSTVSVVLLYHLDINRHNIPIPQHNTQKKS